MKHSIFIIPLLSMVVATSQASVIKQEVFDLPITTLSGETINLSQYKNNKPIYVKFWATWCQPCRKQMPHFQHIQEKYGEKINVVAINLGVNDDINHIKDTKNEFGLTMPIAVDTSNKLAQAFNLVGTPYHILIDKDGSVVHKGHDASKKLDDKIQLLAAGGAEKLPDVSIASASDASVPVKNDSKKVTALFFVATWCDWYLKESRRSMSKNCIKAQNTINTLYLKYPQYNWVGVASRLWTGKKELEEYRKKFNILHPLVIDSSNKTFLQYEIKNFPTLVLLKDNKEVLRVDKFDNQKQLSYRLEKIEL